jgi:hypothetical protein
LIRLVLEEWFAMTHDPVSLPMLCHGHGATSPARYGKRMTFLALLLALLVLPALVQASELRVRVFERGGERPLTGVSVCLGTSANPAQFGSVQTDGEGYARFAGIPRAPLLVTASKDGYKGEQQPLVTSSIPRLLVMSLAPGGGAAQCTTAGTPAVERTGGMQITGFGINNGAAASTDRLVHLDFRASGHPNEYRASENPNFSDTEWQPYSEKPAFTLSAGDGRKTVYFQLRRYSKINGADLQTLSPVVHDSIVLQGR